VTPLTEADIARMAAITERATHLATHLATHERAHRNAQAAIDAQAHHSRKDRSK
jgi:ribosomal protein S15P/S13E